MTLEQLDRGDGRLARCYEYDDRTVIAVDFGVDGADAAVDLVGATAIVVSDDEQYELELPTEDAHTFMKNGVLTIELEDAE